ncbi:hypothetical protein AGRA3207_002346 [Actinomadura graeca]|uniref:Uncharacterized protein n=1 Tax=Actinomadura graeca TaxID=2750812 RepID=A0ABX8QUT7_9ACTN|nr:hypothetical protein [Actinomadura graeca]QXJ21487.1 hypothetical protein AGRA3207_002346 [Actinomadura graeca]
MRRRRNVPGKDPGNLVFGTIGWLFADLMLALAMAFLVATTFGQSVPAKAGRSPTPSPTFRKGLESDPVTITMRVDWQGLMSEKTSAKAEVQKKVRATASLNGRQAGLVLSFGGGLENGTRIARGADAALRELGDQRFVFQGTVYRPFVSFNSAPETLTLDIYLLRQ